MKFDLTVIKNESLVKFEKAMKSVSDKFSDMLSIALDTAKPMVNEEEREQLETNLLDLMHDEFTSYYIKFSEHMNKVQQLVESSL